MEILDKTGLLTALAVDRPVVIELGCGPRKRRVDAIGIDKLDFPSVDLVGDVFAILARFPTASVRECLSYHFLEHVERLPELLDELGRIVIPGGRVTAVVPHFSSPYYYSDYTHTRFFGLYTFSYLCRDRIFKRRVPSYARIPVFELEQARLVFRSPFQSRSRQLVKTVATRFFNRTWAMKEFYEENLCWLLPCYEIEFSMVRIASGESATDVGPLGRASDPRSPTAAPSKKERPSDR